MKERVKEAADWIKFYYSTYHSVRQVRDKLVILYNDKSSVEIRFRASSWSLIKRSQVSQ